MLKSQYDNMQAGTFAKVLANGAAPVDRKITLGDLQPGTIFQFDDIDASPRPGARPVRGARDTYMLVADVAQASRRLNGGQPVLVLIEQATGGSRLSNKKVADYADYAVTVQFKPAAS